MNEFSRKPAHTVTELASARQHQESPAARHLTTHTPARAFHLGTTGICVTKSRGRLLRLVDLSKAPAVEIFAWLPVGINYNKPARGSVSLI